MAFNFSVPPRFGNDSNGADFFYPLFGYQGEAVETGQLFKPVEFDGFKIRIVQLLPDPEIFDGVPVPEPIPDQIVGPVRILEPGNVRYTDIIGVFCIEDGDITPFDLQLCCHDTLLYLSSNPFLST